MAEDLKNKERELKIMLTQDQFESLLNSYDFPITIRQTNTYYDTVDHRVKKMNGALRLRKIEDRTIFTLKKRIDPITLIELEKDIDTDDLRLIEDPEILDWLKQYGISKEHVAPIVQFSTIRHILNTKDAQICLDENKFEHSMDYELEYEYKVDHDGVHELNVFLNKIGIQYTKNGPSKLQRAMIDQQH